MKNLKIKSFVGILFITIILMPICSSTVLAATNHSYGESTAVTDTSIDDKAKNAGLAELVATLVYWLASWLEKVVADAFEMLTGTNEFPWADRVIFNSISFLDVNFINPADGSLFKSAGKETALASVVYKVYGSVMTLCIGFLGVIVSIMAIRLSISIIASEKAKYKQAITRFAMAIVMLFCVHFIITLVFYVNEKLVETASSILIDTIQEQSLKNNLDLTSKISYESTVQNFLDANNATDSIDEVDIAKALYISDSDPNFAQVRNDIASHLKSLSYFKSCEDLNEYITKNKEIAGRLLRSLSGSRYSVAKGSEEQNAAPTGGVSVNTKVNKKDAKIRLAVDIWLVSGRESLEDDKYTEVTNSGFNSSRDKYVNEYGKKVLEVFNDNTVDSLTKTLFEVRDSNKNNYYYLYDAYTYNHYYFDDGSEPSFYYKTETEYGLKKIEYFAFIGGSGSGKTKIGETVQPVVVKDVSVIKTSMKSFVVLLKRYKQPYFNKLRSLYNSYSRTESDPEYVSPNISDEPIAIISSLGKYFKESVWGYESETDEENNVVVKGWTPSNFTISGAIIYAIFILQSIMFLFAYIKRFFYVTILAMFAPVVVIYDFMVKSIS